MQYRYNFSLNENSLTHPKSETLSPGFIFNRNTPEGLSPWPAERTFGRCSFFEFRIGSFHHRNLLIHHCH
jgi:hypothetical protein